MKYQTLSPHQDTAIRILAIKYPYGVLRDPDKKLRGWFDFISNRIHFATIRALKAKGFVDAMPYPNNNPRYAIDRYAKLNKKGWEYARERDYERTEDTLYVETIWLSAKQYIYPYFRRTPRWLLSSPLFGEQTPPIDWYALMGYTPQHTAPATTTEGGHS